MKTMMMIITTATASTTTIVKVTTTACQDKSLKYASNVPKIRERHEDKTLCIPFLFTRDEWSASQ